MGASRLVGDPVDIVTGAVIDQDTEFRVPGAPVPLIWARYYDSRYAGYDRGIGRGFRHALDHELRFDVDGVTYSDPRWSETGFPFLQRDGERLTEQGIVLQRIDLRTYRVELPTGWWLEFSFDGHSHLARLDRIKAREHYVTLEYEDRSRQLLAVRLADVGSLRLDWSDGRISRVVLLQPEPKPELVAARYHYDDRSCLVEAVNAYKHSLKYAFDVGHRLLSKTDRRGFTYHYVYDAEGRCIESRGEDGAQAVQLEYRPLERTTIVTRHDGGKWQYQYSDSGTIMNILDPCGGMQSFLLDDAGLVVMEVDPLGNETQILYDEGGNAAAKRDLWGYRLPIEPDERATHPLEHRMPTSALGYCFGELFAPPEHLPTDGDAFWEVPWQARALLVTAAPDWGGRVQREFTELGTPLCDRREDGKTRRWAYDGNTNLRWLQDFDGGKRSFEYASDSLLVRETNAVGAVTRFEHSASGQLTALTDAGGTRSEYLRDLNDRVIEVRRHGRTRERYTLDLAGNLVQKRDAHGVLLLDMTIGRGNLEVGRKLGSGEIQSFDYDERGQLIEACGEAGRCTFAYGNWGERTADMRDGQGVTHRAVGPYKRTRVLDRFVTEYLREKNGELLITDPTGREHRIRALSRGVFALKWSNRASEISQFDVDGRCLSKTLLHFDGDDRPWQRRFVYSGEGDLLMRHDNERGDSAFRYDAAHRLVQVTHASGRIEQYEHDLAGNLRRMPHAHPASRDHDHGQRLELQAGNRLLRVGVETFEYDARDHVVRRETPFGASEYLRNSLDQLIRVRGPGLDIHANYDPLGRRTRKSVNDRTTEYYWDGDRLAAELLPAGGVRVYVYAARLAMTPLMFVDYPSLDAPADCGRRYFVVSDHRGAVELILDDAAESVWSARLDPYGLAQIEHGPHFYMPLRFPGHFHDVESGLHYNRFRYYDPALGRYLESDPLGIEGGRNLYAYTRNPLREVDLRGLTGGPNCKACQEAAEQAAATEGLPKHETPNDADPALLPKNAPDPKKHALSPAEAEAKANAAAHAALADLQRRAALPKDHPEYLSKKQCGPVVVALVDRKTGAVFLATNHLDAPENVHPTLKGKLADCQADPQHPSEPGTHAEVHALNDALHARDGAGEPSGPDALDDMHMMPLWTKGKPGADKPPGGMVSGEPAPRCGNCQVITDGVQNHSGDAPRQPLAD